MAGRRRLRNRCHFSCASSLRSRSQNLAAVAVIVTAADYGRHRYPPSTSSISRAKSCQRRRVMLEDDGIVACAVAFD